MTPRSTGRGSLAISLVVLLVGACSSGAPPATGTPQATGTQSPSTAGPSTASLPATRSAPPSPTPTGSARSEPPSAALAAEGGDPVTGELGTFTWGDGGSDSPWLPGSPLTVGAGEPLTVSVADGIGVGRWSARRVPGGTADGAGAVALGSGTGPIAFQAPGLGVWSVQVEVGFAGGLGSATYYWQLTVR